MINVYTNSDTEETFNVTQDGTIYNLTTESITKVTAYACSGEVISSDDVDTPISWVDDVLSIKFGYLGLAPGRHSCKVKFYSAAEPLGFVVSDLTLQVTC